MWRIKLIGIHTLSGSGWIKNGVKIVHGGGER